MVMNHIQTIINNIVQIYHNISVNVILPPKASVIINGSTINPTIINTIAVTPIPINHDNTQSPHVILTI